MNEASGVLVVPGRPAVRPRHPRLVIDEEKRKAQNRESQRTFRK